MKKRNWAAVIAIGLAVIGLCAWGITENIHKNRYRRLIDSMYERSLYAMIDNMENIEIKLEKLLIAEDTSAGNKLIADIWRQSYSVSENLSQIPAGTGSLEEMMSFVNKLGEYCMSLSYKETIDQTDRENLRAMLKVCKGLCEDVQNLRLSSIAGNYSLSQPLTAEGEMPMDGIAMNGIDYPTLIYDGPFSDAAVGPPLWLPSKIVSEEEAQAAAVAFMGADRVKSIVKAGEESGEIPTWNFTVTLSTNLVLQMAVTKQGGIVLWMLPESIPASVTLQADEAIAYADYFFKSRGFETMELVHWQVFGSTVLLAYVDVMYDMLIYSDMIKLQVSLDTGEIIGYEAGNFLRSHRLRGYPDVLVTEDEALEAAGELENKQIRLCMIPLNGVEIACYEVKGEFMGGTFFVYVDTLTGEVTNVLKLTVTDGGSLTL